MNDLIEITEQSLIEALKVDIYAINTTLIDSLTRLLATLYSYKLQVSTNNKAIE